MDFMQKYILDLYPVGTAFLPKNNDGFDLFVQAKAAFLELIRLRIIDIAFFLS